MSYTEICNAYVQREKIKKSWYTRTGRTGGWGSDSGGSSGRVRLGTSEDGQTLLSYGHWAMAVWTKEGQLVINGINHTSVTTRKQQGELRAAAVRNNVLHCLIPFPALREAGFYDDDIPNIKIIATTLDREEVRWAPCRSKWCEEHGHLKDGHRTINGVVQSSGTVHFLGETLFRLNGNLYVCGLDRNDDPNRRSFYLTQLPKGAKANTVDGALLKLRPKNLPKTTLRQGEWFLVPSDVRPPAEMQIREYTQNGRVVGRGIPLISDKPEAISAELTNSYIPFNRRQTRHVATRVFLNGAVFVSGCLRDEQHGRLKLGNGKQWFKVVKNLAVGGWTVGKGGAQVD